MPREVMEYSRFNGDSCCNQIVESQAGLQQCQYRELYRDSDYSNRVESQKGSEGVAHLFNGCALSRLHSLRSLETLFTIELNRVLYRGASGEQYKKYDGHNPSNIAQQVRCRANVDDRFL